MELNVFNQRGFNLILNQAEYIYIGILAGQSACKILALIDSCSFIREKVTNLGLIQYRIRYYRTEICSCNGEAI